VLNGTLHFSVLDGWWVEGYQPEAGWALTNEITYEDNNLQDDLDSEIIYSLLEQEIIPAFYDRNKTDIPETWVRFMKNSIASIAPHFVTSRMLNDYNHRFYSKLFKRTKAMAEDDFEMAKRISSWKKRIKRAWKNITVVDYSIFSNGSEAFEMDHAYQGRIVLDLNEISPNDVGVELVITENGERLIATHEFTLDNSVVDKALFRADIIIKQPGTFSYGIRIFPKSENLPHRQDFDLVKWI
jgi:glucan phosphorylase